MLIRPRVEDSFVRNDRGVKLHHERLGRVHDVLVGWICFFASRVPAGGGQRTTRGTLGMRFEGTRHNIRAARARDAHPTTQSTTPPMRLKSSWGCQNHPEANTATSFEGLLAVVAISGQMLLLMVMADLRGVIDLVRNALVANEEQVESREVPIVAAIATFMIPVLAVLFLCSSSYHRTSGGCDDVASHNNKHMFVCWLSYVVFPPFPSEIDRPHKSHGYPGFGLSHHLLPNREQHTRFVISNPDRGSPPRRTTTTTTSSSYHGKEMDEDDGGGRSASSARDGADCRRRTPSRRRTNDRRSR